MPKISVWAASVPKHIREYIDNLVEDLGAPYTRSFVVFKALELFVEQHKKGEIEL